MGKCNNGDCICSSCLMRRGRSNMSCNCIQYGITIQCNTKKKKCRGYSPDLDHRQESLRYVIMNKGGHE